MSSFPLTNSIIFQDAGGFTNWWDSKSSSDRRSLSIFNNGHFLVKTRVPVSMDWFKGKFTGKPHI